MITISEPALGRLIAIETKVGRALRLELQHPRVPLLTLGSARPDDVVVRQNGRDILYVSAAIRAGFPGSALGTSRSDGGAFILVPPRASGPWRRAAGTLAALAGRR